MWCAIIVTLIFALGPVCAEALPRVKTEFGIHEGIWNETVREVRYASYLGIPYAKAPIEGRRFKAPEPWTKQWRKSRDFKTYPKACALYNETNEAKEDCLYLNIFTRQHNQYARNEVNGTKRSVLVFLISDLSGHSENHLYYPYYILEQDIVLVTVNYRQGIFGFFTTGDEAAPGNYGLKDVLEALRWLKKNIEAFGGNPDSITLMGHGKGAGVVHLLVLSDKSEGLFHRYVTQSGSAQSPWSYRSREKVKIASLKLASSVNCSHDTSEEIVKCLQQLQTIELGQAIELVDAWEDYVPINEPESKEAVITQHPMKLIEDGKARDIPWMTGVVANEGLLMTILIDKHAKVCSKLAEKFDYLVLDLGNFEGRIVDTPSFIEHLKSFYFSGNITAGDCADNFEELFGDIMVNWPVYEALNSQIKGMKSDVYLYKFDYRGTFTMTYELDSRKRYGVAHGDELNYLFPVQNDLFLNMALTNSGDDKDMISFMTERWANFVKTGVPSANLYIEWQPYQKENSYMEFGNHVELSMQTGFLEDRMDFWANVTEKFISKPAEMKDERGDAEILKISSSLLVVLLIPIVLAY